MMYKRRKIVLGLIEEFDGKLCSTSLQKLMFLLSREQSTKSFDFIPYKFGCYSFQLNHDLKVMTNKGILTKKNEHKSNFWQLNEGVSYFNELTPNERSLIKLIKQKFESYSLDELIRFTYQKYPFYAINSTIAEDLLSPEEFSKVQKQKRSINKKALFTIGYEGISLETYINKLIINDVKVLCDVRKNALSQKFGFSKTQLKKACDSANIEYIHIPELGIISEKRQELNSLKDYQNLFAEYEKTVLINNKEYLTGIKSILDDNNRIALTCFEKEVKMCHRGRIAKALFTLPDMDIPLINL